ncbi:MAG: endonuclease [Myxococcota bacterium]
MARTSRRDRTKALLDRHGSTFAEEAGIRLRDKPAPLYQLLVLATLLSARISAEHGVRATRALKKRFATPRKMADATWQQRVDVLTRHGYKRFDESAARMLGDGARRVLDEYDGDLRKLREAADGDEREAMRRLRAFKGIGEIGAAIFLREVQGIWEEFRPFADDRVLRAARRLDLGSGADALARLVEGDALPRLEAALVRVDLADAYDEVWAEAG